MTELSIYNRMKEFYESRSRTYLTRRTPCIIRIDGCHFHTFTRGFEKPFDNIFIKSMIQTTKNLCEEIQGCVLGYVQSDEISLLLVDFKQLNSEAWFSYQVQKICSVSASMAAAFFNKAFKNEVENFAMTASIKDYDRLIGIYENAIKKTAYFDSRCFSIPKEEVSNYFLSRQLDATRNSIQGLAQANFSNRELHGLSCNKLQDKLYTEKNINWNDLPTMLRRGTCLVKSTYEHHRGWLVDDNIPIFSTEEGRKYVEDTFKVEEE